MIHWSGRFFITEDLDEKCYKVGIYLNKGDNEYRFGIKVPKESLEPIKQDLSETEFVGLDKKNG